MAAAAAGQAPLPVGDAATRRTVCEHMATQAIQVGQLDLFRDEDLTYALRLSRVGVEVEFHLRPGVPHLFDVLAPNSDVAHRAIADRARALAAL